MSRQPLILRACVVAGVGVLAAIAEHHGTPIPPELRQHLTEVGVLLGPVVLALWARRKVTPVDTPRTADGRPLVPAETRSDLGAIASGGSGQSRHTPAQ